MNRSPQILPIRAFLRDSEPWMEYIDAAGHRFTEPFFSDSLAAIRSARVEAPLRPPETPVRLSGLIFHMSRCGSTLISRSLAAVDSVRVISEAAPLDDIVQTGRADWLAWMASALAGEEPVYILKLDAWHIRSLPLFREAFPDVPWIFVCRDPLEVLVSQLRQPGIPALGGAIDPSILGMTFEDAIGLDRPVWTGRVLEGLMRAALRFRGDPGGLVVDYRELPDAIWDKVAPHFGLALTPDEEARVREAARSDAKNPSQLFLPDGEAKCREAEALEPDPGRAVLRELYSELRVSLVADR